MLEFQKINEKNAAELAAIYRKSDYRICDYSIGVKLMWTNGDYRFAFACGCANLVGKTVGESSKFEVEDETLDTDDKTVNYSAVKVNWIVKNDKELGTVKDTTYTEKKELADVKGDKIDLKDVELTYHIFPVYLVKVADKLTADVVIDEFYTQLAATKVDPDDSTKTVNKFDAVANGAYSVSEAAGKPTSISLKPTLRSIL